MGHQGEDNFVLRLIQRSNSYTRHYRDFSQTTALDAIPKGQAALGGIALTLFQGFEHIE